MTVYPRFLCCLYLASSVLLASDISVAQTAAQPATFRTAAQMVLVPITVTDHSGKTVAGLRAQDFTVLDDQRPQQIVSFAREDAPCSVGLVMDISGSMQHLLNTTKEAAQTFLKAANPDDEFLLLTVSTEPETTARFSRDVAAIEENIEGTRPGGFTALIDTVYLALNSMRKAHMPRRALLIISDGLDNHSRYSKAELMRVALEADVQVYTIVYDNPAAAASGNGVPLRPRLVGKPWDQAREREGPQLLQELSAKTGGLHFRVSKDGEAKEAAMKASRAIREEYVIGYQTPDAGIAGKWHRVRIKSELPKVNIYARSGYYSR